MRKGIMTRAKKAPPVLTTSEYDRQHARAIWIVAHLGTRNPDALEAWLAEGERLAAKRRAS